MKARFIQEIGTRASLRIYWGDDCPRCLGSGNQGYHNAHTPLTQSAVLGDWKLGGEPSDYPEERWPTNCDHCGAAAPPEAKRQVFRERRFNTASGEPEPGDIYETTWEHEDGGRGACAWTNCAGPHLHAVTPNGSHWNVDSRASNCTMPGDTTHRCWIRRGDPRTGLVHVDKSGPTCAAGAGSIAVDGWHGFLHQGEWRAC
jgi:hypothetical protein